MTETYIIAEAGVNHNGSLVLAKEMIDCAQQAGANAIKFQSFQADKLATQNAPKAAYQERMDCAESQFAMLKKLELSHEAHLELMNYCHNKNIHFLSTPFDLESLQILVHDCDVSRIKIASGEITNALLLLKAAQTGKPVILSTGMASLGEVERALTILAYGYLNATADIPAMNDFIDAYRNPEGQLLLRKNVTLLHCTTDYPAAYVEINLKAMDTLQNAFGLNVGYSDHTQGIEISIAAVARGARIIEKHFTLDKNLPGPDHQASLEPRELAQLISSIRNVEASLGHAQKIPSASEFKNRVITRKSLVAIQKIAQGDAFTLENLGLKRPGNGISGHYFWHWLGKIANKDYNENDLITDL